MKKSDLITHVSIAVITFTVMIPSIVNHGISLNSSVYFWGAIANVGLAFFCYSMVGGES